MGKFTMENKELVEQIEQLKKQQQENINALKTIASFVNTIFRRENLAGRINIIEGIK
jgi:hypothetical protein